MSFNLYKKKLILMKKIELSLVISIISKMIWKCQNFLLIYLRHLKTIIIFRCSFKPSFSKPILPNLSSDQDGDANQILRKHSITGLNEKFKKVFKINEEDFVNDKKYLNYKDRLEHELDIIIEMKYASYFLIVSDYIKWAKENDIPVGPGRGSGAGSLVAWCLSITDVDPIKFNLIFERFFKS